MFCRATEGEGRKREGSVPHEGEVGVDKFMVAIVMELLVYCFSFKIG